MAHIADAIVVACKEVVLIHHEECGAYGLESTLKKYPNLIVNLYYLELSGEFIKI